MSRLEYLAAQNSHHSVTDGSENARFVERLQLIAAHFQSTDRLARSMGVSPSAFRKWLKGEAEPNRTRLVALARAAGVSVAWLAQGDGPAPVFAKANAGNGAAAGAFPPAPWPDGAVSEHFVLLPKTPVPVPTATMPMQHFLAVHHDWIRAVCGVDAEALVLEIAADEAMAPTIARQDILLVDTTQCSIEGDGIYVLEVSGRRRLRRVQRRHDGGLLLICDNGAYQPEAIDQAATASIRIIGRVVWAGGTL